MTRQRKIYKETAESIIKLKAIGVSIAEIARKKKVSRQTIYSVLGNVDKYLTDVLT